MKRLRRRCSGCSCASRMSSTAAFGDRLNPLYHLGAITFFLFWVVAGSGLYLYAFFETGVADAHASVEGPTHHQWFAGGILRSLHRYASDAMVVTMLHAPAAPLRLRPLPRLPLVLVVVGRGADLGRVRQRHQRLHAALGPPGAVRDHRQLRVDRLVARLRRHADAQPDPPEQHHDRFSLLAFHAHRHPAGVAAAGCSSTCSACPSARIRRAPSCSAWRHAAAAGAAAPGAGARAAPPTSPARCRSCSSTGSTCRSRCSTSGPGGAVWALVVAGTWLLALLPWLPPQAAARPRRRVQLTLHPRRSRWRCAAARPLLEAGLRQARRCPTNAATAAAACMCTVLHGTVDHGIYQRSALPDAARPGQDADAARRRCRTSTSRSRRRATRARRRPCTRGIRVVRMDRFSDDVIRLIVALPDGQDRPSAPASTSTSCSTTASAARSFQPAAGARPHRAACAAHPAGASPGQVFTQMKVGDTLRFEAAGDFTLREGESPILFVAGATGFAPIKSIVEDASRAGITRPMRLYWRASAPTSTRWIWPSSGSASTPTSASCRCSPSPIRTTVERLHRPRPRSHAGRLPRPQATRSTCGSVKMVEACGSRPGPGRRLLLQRRVWPSCAAAGRGLSWRGRLAPGGSQAGHAGVPGCVAELATLTSVRCARTAAGEHENEARVPRADPDTALLGDPRRSTAVARR